MAQNVGYKNKSFGKDKYSKDVHTLLDILTKLGVTSMEEKMRENHL